jgi:hypothetical protein
VGKKRLAFVLSLLKHLGKMNVSTPWQAAERNMITTLTGAGERSIHSWFILSLPLLLLIAVTPDASI